MMIPFLVCQEGGVSSGTLFICVVIIEAGPGSLSSTCMICSYSTGGVTSALVRQGTAKGIKPLAAA